MPLFRALGKNMAPMTNADESTTNRLTLFPIYLSSLCSIYSLTEGLARHTSEQPSFTSAIMALILTSNSRHLKFM